MSRAAGCRRSPSLQPEQAGSPHQEKTMVNKAVAAIAVLLLCAPALADEAAIPKIGEPRYSFYKVADGFLRLDTQSGEVARCSVQPVGWACLAAPEDRAVLEDQIDRLRKENAALKQDLLSHGLPLPTGVVAESSGNDNGHELTLHLPDNADLNRVMALVGRVWNRFVEVIGEVQNRVMHKS
jgi:hypothetical protein